METRCAKRRRMLAATVLSTENQLKAAFDKHLATSSVSPALALVRLMQRHSLTLDMLRSLEPIASESFSTVEYEQIADEFCKASGDALSPELGGTDIPTAPANLCRIPRELFKSVIQDIDRATKQYGKFFAQPNEEARQRYLSSWLDRLVSCFQGGITNLPEMRLAGRAAKGGQVEFQYHAVGSCVVLLIETKFNLTAKNFTKSIAQTLCELAGADFKNFTKSMAIPAVRAILTDGRMFHFLEFRGEDRKVYFLTPGSEVSLLDVQLRIQGIKTVCERFFWMLLDGWCQALEAFRLKSRNRSENPRKSLKLWEEALATATAARAKGVEAASKESDDLAKECFEQLARSYEMVPKQEAGLDEDPELLEAAFAKMK